MGMQLIINCEPHSDVVDEGIRVFIDKMYRPDQRDAIYQKVASNSDETQKNVIYSQVVTAALEMYIEDNGVETFCRELLRTFVAPGLDIYAARRIPLISENDVAEVINTV